MFARRKFGITALVIAIWVSLNAYGPEARAGTHPASPDEPSPAGCTIAYITNPHFARSVPGAVKVNVMAECAVPVPEHDLSVTLPADGRPVAKSTASSRNKVFVMNQGTFVRCSNFTDQHSFQGEALGTSWEDNKPYVQIDVGPTIVLACGL